MSSTLNFRTMQQGWVDQGQCLLKKSRFEHIILPVQGHKQLVAGAEEEGAHGARVAGGDHQPGGELSHLS